MAMTADRLLTGVKRRIVVPSSQALMTDEDILAFADDIISSRIVPLLESVNQEFFVTRHDIALVAGQTEYSIPYRAIGRALRELKITDDNHNVRNVALVALEDEHLYQQSATTVGFNFLSDKIHLIPDVPANVTPDQTLLLWYRLPPSTLVQTALAALVTAVADPNVTVSAVPATFLSGVEVDFIQGKSGSSIYAIDKAITNISGTTLTFAANTVPSDLAVGDYISLAGTSPVINFIPNECYSLIESQTAYRVLTAVGDFDGAKILAQDITIEERNAKQLLEPRIDGEPTIIINRYGLVRGSRSVQRSWLFGQ